MFGRQSKHLLILPGLALAVSLAFGGFAQVQEPESILSKLTPKIRDLLRREMIFINDARQQILSAMVAGDDAKVAVLAQ